MKVDHVELFKVESRRWLGAPFTSRRHRSSLAVPPTDLVTVYYAERRGWYYKDDRRGPIFVQLHEEERAGDILFYFENRGIRQYVRKNEGKDKGKDRKM